MIRLITAAILLFCSETSAKNYSLATWNILCETCNPGSQIAPWEERKHGVIQRIMDGDADILALQEVQTGSQLDYVVAELPNYSHCIGPIDNSMAHVITMVKSNIPFSCESPILIADNRACVRIIIDDVNYYNCHLPLTLPLNTLATDTFIAEAAEPFIFMGDFNTHSNGYPENDLKLMVYPQTREDENGPLSFWNIDRIGTSENLTIRFNRDALTGLSDHPYLAAKFYPSPESLGMITIINLYVLED